MPTLTAALIQFIGIVLFSKELDSANPQPHLQAVVPNLAATHERHEPKIVLTKDGPTRPNRQTIEDHVAVIAFPACDYVSSRGWVPQALESVPGFLYVRLDGERIEFLPTNERGVVGTSYVPTNDGKERQGELKLPHLRDGCCTKSEKKSLKAAYKAPNYTGAVAVFDLGNGVARACRAWAEGVSNNRIDTRVTIETEGQLVIAATSLRDKNKKKASKEIRLRGTTHVLVANIPTVGFTETGDPNLVVSLPHYMAYYAMVDGSPRCASDFACATKQEDIPMCDVKSYLRPIADESVSGRPNGWNLGPIGRVDFQCSNSQWP